MPNFHQQFFFHTLSSGFEIWCMDVYFTNKKLAKFVRKKDQIWIFHDLLGARQHTLQPIKFFLDRNGIWDFGILDEVADLVVSFSKFSWL